MSDTIKPKPLNIPKALPEGDGLLGQGAGGVARNNISNSTSILALEDGQQKETKDSFSQAVIRSGLLLQSKGTSERSGIKIESGKLLASAGVPLYYTESVAKTIFHAGKLAVLESKEFEGSKLSVYGIQKSKERALFAGTSLALVAAPLTTTVTLLGAGAYGVVTSPTKQQILKYKDG